MAVTTITSKALFNMAVKAGSIADFLYEQDENKNDWREACNAVKAAAHLLAAAAQQVQDRIDLYNKSIAQTADTHGE